MLQGLVLPFVELAGLLEDFEHAQNLLLDDHDLERLAFIAAGDDETGFQLRKFQRGWQGRAREVLVDLQAELDAKVVEDVLVEPSICDLQVGEPMQLERVGYFCIDPDTENEGRLILNRSVAMRDGWAKKMKNYSV